MYCINSYRCWMLLQWELSFYVFFLCMFIKSEWRFSVCFFCKSKQSLRLTYLPASPLPILSVRAATVELKTVKKRKSWWIGAGNGKDTNKNAWKRNRVLLIKKFLAFLERWLTFISLLEYIKRTWSLLTAEWVVDHAKSDLIWQ